MPTPTRDRPNIRPIGTPVNITFGPGASVALDLTKTSYVGIQGGFVLSFADPVGVIPHNLPGEAFAALHEAFQKGYIVLGTEPVRPPPPPDPLEEYFNAVDSAKVLMDLKKPLTRLARAKNMGTLSTYERYSKLLDYETTHSNRPEFVQYLNNCMERTIGPRPIVDKVEDRQQVAIPESAIEAARSPQPESSSRPLEI